MYMMKRFSEQSITENNNNEDVSIEIDPELDGEPLSDSDYEDCYDVIY